MTDVWIAPNGRMSSTIPAPRTPKIHPSRVLCPSLQNQAPLSFRVSFTSSESVNP